VRTRVVAATNRNIEALVRKGRVRLDLFYRLNGHRVRVPPLRDRPRENPPARRRVRTGGPIYWDLERRSSKARVVFVAGERARAPDADPRRGRQRRAGRLARRERAERDGPRHSPSPKLPSFRVLRAETERRSLTRALAMNDGNVTAAARALGISRQAFYKAMRRAGLSRKGDVNLG